MIAEPIYCNPFYINRLCVFFSIQQRVNMCSFQEYMTGLMIDILSLSENILDTYRSNIFTKHCILYSI